MTVEEIYWENRYSQGGNSGLGSIGKMGDFKAIVINSFLKDNNVNTVLEFGVGDGLQLKKLKINNYVGTDISLKAIQLCQEKFKDDNTKVFKLVQEYLDEIAECTMSLDVIYHIIDEDIFCGYMQRLFNSSTKYVIIYASDFSAPQFGHEYRRKFTDWVEKHTTEDWKLLMYIPNEFPYDEITGDGSYSNFFIYEKRS